MSLKVEKQFASAGYPILDQQIARIDSLRGLQLRSAQPEPTLLLLRQLVASFPRHIVAIPDASICSWWRGRLCKDDRGFELTNDALAGKRRSRRGYVSERPASGRAKYCGSFSRG